MNNCAKDLPKRTPRERVWDEIRKAKGEFTLDVIAENARMNVDSARDYFTGLRRAGFIAESRRERVRFKAVSRVYYKLVNDVGNDAPAVNRKGEVLQPRAVNFALWNSLRICGAVTPRALAAYASTDDLSVAENTANCYLQDLHKAGYVSVIRPSSYLNQATYLLLKDKNTGPKPPQIQRAKQVYDPNIGAVVYAERPELAEELRDGVHPELEGYGHE